MSASTSSAATEHNTGALLQSTAKAATEHNAHYTDLAAVILDAAMKQSLAEGYSKAKTEAWFRNLKQDIIDLTFVPLTRCALVKRTQGLLEKNPREEVYGLQAWSQFRDVLQLIIALPMLQSMASATELLTISARMRTRCA